MPNYRWRSPRSEAKAAGWGPVIWCVILIAVVVWLMINVGCAAKAVPQVDPKAPVAGKASLTLNPAQIITFAKWQEVNGRKRYGAWISLLAETHGLFNWCPTAVAWVWPDGSHAEEVGCGERRWYGLRFVEPGSYKIRFTLVGDDGGKYSLLTDVTVRAVETGE